MKKTIAGLILTTAFSANAQEACGTNVSEVLTRLQEDFGETPVIEPLMVSPNAVLVIVANKEFGNGTILTVGRDRSWCIQGEFRGYNNNPPEKALLEPLKPS